MMSFLLFVTPLFAGQIRFVKTLTPSAPNDQGIFTIIDGAGVATQISGFESLQGFAPSRITFKIHVKLRDLNFNTQTGDFVAVLGPDPAVPHTTEIFLDGNLIAHSSDAVYISKGNVLENHAQSRSREHAGGVVGHPFHSELLAQSRGTGGITIVFDPYPAQQAGAFQVTGTLTVTSPFDVRVEPQPAVAGDNLTMVISGSTCNPEYAPAELAAGAATAVRKTECLATPIAFETRVPLGALPAGDYNARALDEAGLLEGQAEFTVGSRDSSATVCVPDAHTLCLRGGRFRVTAFLDEPALVAQSGPPQARLMSFESGAFSFFSSSNTELFVKVLDGCGVNGRYWLFASGLTNLGARITVQDMRTVAARFITNPHGKQFESVAETNVFRCTN